MALFLSGFSRLTPLLTQRSIPSTLLLGQNRRYSQITRNFFRVLPPLFAQTNSLQVSRVKMIPYHSRICYHNCSTISRPPLIERARQIQRTFDSISLLTNEEQRANIIILLAKEFKFSIEDKEQITEETVKGMLRFVFKKNQTFTLEDLEGLPLMKTKKWKAGWNKALTLLLDEFAYKKITWLGDKRRQELPSKIESSIWRTSKIPFDFPGEREEDKEKGLEISIKKAQEWQLQNPNGRVVAIQEGIWDGNFLIQLYMQLIRENIDTKLVATDINPTSLALFQLKCKFLGIPFEDFLTYLNSLHQPINLHEIKKLSPSPLNTQVLNIYFRVILDLEENETLDVFNKKAEEMNPDDLLIVTLVEEAPNSIEALQAAGLKKEKEGEFFTQYSNQSSSRLSTVLALKKNYLTNLQSHLTNFRIYDQRKVNIFLEIGSKKSSPFEAFVVAFQLRKTPNRV